MNTQTRRHTTLKVKDLVTGKTMTVEEWKAQRRNQPQQTTDKTNRNSNI